MDDKSRTPDAAPHDRPGDDYDVGYGRPPPQSQFRAGRSGNPRGRPRGPRTCRQPPSEERLQSLVLAEAYRTISVNDGGRPVTISIAKAIFRSLALGAAKGEHRAQRLFTEILIATESAVKTRGDAYLRAMIDYKLEWEQELERRRVLGIEAPDPIPHPDHIIIDTRHGSVRVQGPLTKADKVRWDRLRDRKVACDEGIVELEREIARERDDGIRTLMRDELAREQSLRATIAQLIPNGGGRDGAQQTAMTSDRERPGRLDGSRKGQVGAHRAMKAAAAIYSLELSAIVCRHIAAGQALGVVCGGEGMPARATAFTWLRKHADFARAYETACDVRAKAVSEEIIALGDDLLRDDGMALERPSIQACGPQIDTRTRMMSKLRPKQDADRGDDLTRSGALGPGAAIDLSTMPIEMRDAMIEVLEVRLADPHTNEG